MELHHINLASDKADEMERFYVEVLGLQRDASFAGRRMGDAVQRRALIVSDGDIQIHLAWRDADLVARTGHFVNPIARGHLAFRTDDIAAMRQRLNGRGIPFADYGEWAVRGWHQLFFHDPAGNVVELFEVQPEEADA